jgi:hypothetical protein
MEPLRTLRQCLVDTELAHLRVIARLWGLEVKATRPIEVAAELAKTLVDPTQAADMWEALPQAERTALTELLDGGGLMPVAVFARRFGEIRPMGPGRLERETPWRDPVSVAEGLWYRGLIYEGFAKETGETYPVFFVPRELRAALPLVDERIRATLRLKPAAPPAHQRFAGELLLDDVTTILIFLHNKDLRLAADGPDAWPERVRRDLVSRLRERDPERLAFILQLIRHLGWTRVGEDGRVRLVAEPVMVWLKGTVGESRAILVKAWHEMVDWNELRRLPSLQPDDTGTWRNDPTLARAALSRHLEAVPAGEWVSVDDFINAVKTTDPDFQRPGGDYETWYIRDTASGAYLTGFESWDRVEGALLRALLTGPAWWLGLVELGDGAEETPQVFRTTTEAGLAPTTGTPPAPVIHGDLTVTMPAARRFERFQLARVADLERVDDPYLYRLTPNSLSRARQQRIDAEKVSSFLDGLSDKPLPKAVQSSLERWNERGTEVWIERTVLLLVTDEALMEQIVGSPQTNRYVGRVVGPTTAVVAEKDWLKLLEALAELGVMAELEGYNIQGGS